SLPAEAQKSRRTSEGQGVLEGIRRLPGDRRGRLGFSGRRVRRVMRSYFNANLADQSPRVCSRQADGRSAEVPQGNLLAGTTVSSKEPNNPTGSAAQSSYPGMRNAE